jgi:hypothetical protein
MNPPHLASEDIDFLLDGDEGFGSHPLRKHLEACAECRARLESARAVNALLEHLPHTSPAPGFADSVMSRVNVFEPWYITLAGAVRNVIPRTRPVRALVAAGAGIAAVTVSALAIWISLRLDLAVYAAQLGWTRIQTLVATGAGSVVSATLGEPALAVLRSGGIMTILLSLAGFVLLLAVATLGVRGLVTVARRRRV